MNTAIWWIRRDLRLSDNPALIGAKSHAPQVLPVFILDPTLWTPAKAGMKRLQFLAKGLLKLDLAIRQRGGQLILRSGESWGELSKLQAETQATAIFAQQDFSPYAKYRDNRVATELPLHLVGGQTIHPPSAVRKSDGSPYAVFTPYSRSWRNLPPPTQKSLLKTPTTFQDFPKISSDPIPNPDQYTGDLVHEPGEEHGLQVLSDFVQGTTPVIQEYADHRNRLDLEGTSSLSPYLRFGMVSPRQAGVAALGLIEDPRRQPLHAGAESWYRQLIWREFFTAILDSYPVVMSHSFRPDLRGIPWKNDLDEFEAWCYGQTGYPIVDAAMRQLLQTGWIHNRARMIVASFLVKDLLIDWRWGERWFMQHLIDGDPSANNGGWQWTAGTGTDAAPYFRIFNPILQGKKFDPQGLFVRRWIPELESVPTSHVHAPWEMPLDLQKKTGVQIGKRYPSPIIDHKMARERALAAFAHSKER
jgi:deoxyribodipyrimidine photo-lyase